jgi:hypothetical protein
MGATSGITNQASLVTNNTWSSSSITWNNAPALGTVLASWTVPGVAGEPVVFDVTSAAQNSQSNGNLLSLGISSLTTGGSYWVQYASDSYATASYRPTIYIVTQ